MVEEEGHKLCWVYLWIMAPKQIADVFFQSKSFQPVKIEDTKQ
jgi:hypothetical protein